MGSRREIFNTSVHGKLEEAMTPGLSGADLSWMRMLRLLKVMKAGLVLNSIRGSKSVVRSSVFDSDV